jgi:hypothetical protein
LTHETVWRLENGFEHDHAQTICFGKAEVTIEKGSQANAQEGSYRIDLDDLGEPSKDRDAYEDPNRLQLYGERYPQGRQHPNSGPPASITLRDRDILEGASALPSGVPKRVNLRERTEEVTRPLLSASCFVLAA